MSLDAYPGDDAIRARVAEQERKRAGVMLAVAGLEAALIVTRKPRDARVTMKPGPKPARSLEHLEQVALFDWATEHAAAIPELALLYAVPNGGKRSIAVAGKLKMEGVKPGVPDVVLPVPMGDFAALYVELKKPGGSLTPSQADWQHMLGKVGNKVVVCTTWEMARDHILAYLDCTPRAELSIHPIEP